MINPFIERLAFQLTAHDIASMYSQSLADQFTDTALAKSDLSQHRAEDLVTISKAVTDLLETRLLRREAEEALERYIARVKDHVGQE